MPSRTVDHHCRLHGQPTRVTQSCPPVSVSLPAPKHNDLIPGRARIHTPLHLTDLQLARLDTVMVLALNGNSLPTSFWTLANILSHPDAYARVRAEVDALFATAALPPPARGSGTDSEEVSRWVASLTEALAVAETRDRLPLLDSCTWEALRLTSGFLPIRGVLQDATVTVARCVYPRG